MEQVFIEEETFDKIDFTQNPLCKGEYEYCTFLNCDLSYADLSEFKFLECEFSGCNLSLANLTQTALKDIKFKSCKMLGLNFGDCNEFGFAVSFNTCILDRSSFVDTTSPTKKRVKLKQTIFKNSQLYEVDFTECDLSSAVFDDCDLTGAMFKDTVLEKADLRTAINYSIDPELNRIKKAKFSRSGIAGLLDKYDIQIEIQ
ncbi:MULTISPECIES: pentapeptide repeat-containing protein [unclassified Chamaesiphon]|uniref:pentapeptide repeat-containing protein n=1 Tax=unclassified Chamaesiphon TaxID=2620921 RepID=UPI00286A02BB|nr:MULTISPECIES: pentapeptide repeat-containing protein [unclassified Chamaesiphon]